MTRRRLADDSGAAVAEFVMTSTLVVLVFMAVVQLGLALHVRNTLISCASEGARYGARQGSSPEEGAQRTRDLIGRSLSESYAQDVRAEVQTTEDGVDVVVVSVEAPLPVVGPIGPSDGLDVRGRAFSEVQ
ncbi:hypothetical protein GCM10027055_15070 [Janibacter alkaliphilus]|uniref:Flp pilus assembly protein TadG n=1 Tax=Janibacter alkaliphilus TaxID=1069963 RepID=A0A852X2D9_9MICO|nr:Flp pilus assembly protein TadG [Janibacter alkaliphilus]